MEDDKNNPLMALLQKLKEKQIDSLIRFSKEGTFTIETDFDTKDIVIAMTLFHTQLELYEDETFSDAISDAKPLGENDRLLTEQDILASLNFVSQYYAKRAIDLTGNINPELN